ncbi:MAG TPA: ATP-binding cassette domain-containing protein, partial [Pseudonocardia sp.]|nr:ATP-binding cassette domain-containing protein [Pseudonocardia sp.]
MTAGPGSAPPAQVQADGGTGARADVPELRVEQVTLRFGGITALDDVSFTVRPGQVHALIGPNGAGKSSCFNVVCGLYRPTAGRVVLGQTVLTGLRPHKLAGLGVGRSFQNITLSLHST